MKKIKVIFLDIDGVMNSQVFYRERHKTLKRRLSIIYYVSLSKIKWVLNGFKYKYKSLLNHEIPEKFYKFENQLNRLKEETCSQKWRWLSEFCNEHDIKICVSSVWKNHFGPKGGRDPQLWDKALTELGFKEGTFVGITNTHKSLRGTEIQDWLDENPDVEDYAILDDDADMLEHQFVKFHHCDGWFGLSPNHLYRIHRQFTGESIYDYLSKTVK